MIDEQTQDAIREGVAAAVKEHQKGQPTDEHGQPHHGPYLVLSLEQIRLVSALAHAALNGRPLVLTAPTRAQAQEVYDRSLAALGAHPSWREPHP